MRLSARLRRRTTMHCPHTVTWSPWRSEGHTVQIAIQTYTGLGWVHRDALQQTLLHEHNELVSNPAVLISVDALKISLGPTKLVSLRWDPDLDFFNSSGDFNVLEQWFSKLVGIRITCRAYQNTDYRPHLQSFWFRNPQEGAQESASLTSSWCCPCC